MTAPTPQQILDLPLPDNDADAATIRGYLTALLARLWEPGSDFSSKRPFGMSSWQYDLYGPLVKAGWVPGSLDEDGYVDTCDTQAADRLIRAAITTLGEPAR